MTAKCLVCNGDGRLFRMTPAYEAMATQAAGQSFGWSGQTHEWRECHACKGTGVYPPAGEVNRLLALLAAAERRVTALEEALDEIAEGTTPDRIGQYGPLRDWVHKTARALLRDPEAVK